LWAMATFTKISEKETASITVNACHKIAKINDNIYGGFCESVKQLEMEQNTAHTC
jgi:alpha-L-arabinofuranosidase